MSKAGFLILVAFALLALFFLTSPGQQAIIGGPAASPFQTVTLEAVSITKDEISLVGEASLNVAWPDRDSDPRALGKSVILVDGKVVKVCGGSHRGFHQLDRPAPEALQPCAYTLDLSKLSSGPHIVRYEVKSNAFTSASFTQPSSGVAVQFCDGSVRNCIDQVHYCRWLQMVPRPATCGSDGSLESSYLTTGGPSDKWFVDNWQVLNAPVHAVSDDLVVEVGGAGLPPVVDSESNSDFSIWVFAIVAVVGFALIVAGRRFGVF